MGAPPRAPSMTYVSSATALEGEVPKDKQQIRHGSNPGHSANAPRTFTEGIDKETRKPGMDGQRVERQSITP